MANELDTVRDPSQATGQRDSNEAYRLYRLNFYPNVETEVYRMPPLYLGREPVLGQMKKEAKYGELKCDVYQIDHTHLLGEAADMRVADSIEELLRKDFLEEKEPALILTSYDLTQHEIKSGDKSKTSMPESKDKDIIEGDHDVAIIHKKYGNIFIQVKSARSNLKDPIRKAKNQAEKDKKFFTKLCGDGLNTIQCISTIAFPGVTKVQLKLHFQHDPQTLPLVLCDDNLPSEDTETDNSRKNEGLKDWWNAIKEKVMPNRSGSAVYTMDEYKRVFEIYVGKKSTVSARSFGQSIAALGKRRENILLTPDQIAILKSKHTSQNINVRQESGICVNRLIIRGGYGTGKTTLLILKCKELIKHDEKVAIISMAKSPLIEVLEASIKHDLEEESNRNLTCLTAANQVDLMEKLNELKEQVKERKHVFIDEFPSEMYKDRSLATPHALDKYPEECMVWCVMAREREKNLSSGVRAIFPENFEEVIFKQVLRCPPLISTLYTIDPYTTIVSYNKGQLNAKKGVSYEQERVALYCYSRGMFTKEIQKIVEGDTCKEKPTFPWDALRVVHVNQETLDDKTESYVFLKKLGIPLSYDTDSNKCAMLVRSDDSTNKHFVLRFDGIEIARRDSYLKIGPHIRHIKHINHDHGSLDDCKTCQKELKSIFGQCGLDLENNQKANNASRVRQSEEVIYEREVNHRTVSGDADLSWSDVVILDDRPEECKSAAEFFKKCVPHLINNRDLDLVEDKDISYEDRVLYTKPELFQGMERKVVIVLEKTPSKFRYPVEDGKIRDYTELAISRCSSLLIVMKSDE